MRMYPPFRYDRGAPKKPTNLTINTDLLHKARALDIPLSAVMEEALARAVESEVVARWLIENESAFASYNERVERDGVFSDGLRKF